MSEKQLVIPPEDIRKLAETTAGYVAKNGLSFELMLQEKEADNPKFDFLKQSNIYRAYYDKQIEDKARQILEQNKEVQFQFQQSQQQGVPQQQQQQQQILLQQDLIQNKENILLSQKISQLNPYSNILYSGFKKNNFRVGGEVQAPENDQFFVEHPKDLNSQYVDVIKHTAQFVAKNGKKFLVTLSQREKMNTQFDFLKPTHELFQFFMSLVDAYTKCLKVPSTLSEKILLNYNEKMSILSQCGERFEYENLQKQNQKKQEEIAEEEREQMAAIDWDDFVVVATVDFIENDAPPQNLQQPFLNKHDANLMQNENNLKNYQETNVSGTGGLRMGAAQTQKTVPPVQQPQNLVRNANILPPQIKNFRIEPIPLQPGAPLNNFQTKGQEIEEDLNSENVVIKDNYIRKGMKADEEAKTLFNGKLIPVNQVNEILKGELLDPKYKLIREEIESRADGRNLAQAADISQYLSEMKQNRPDIFGTSEYYQKQMEIETKPIEQTNKPIWDGIMLGMNRTSANIAVMKHQQQKAQTQQNGQQQTQNNNQNNKNQTQGGRN